VIETPKLVRTPAQAVAALHLAIPRSMMQQLMGPAIGEVMAAVRTQGIGPTGPWFAHHLAITPEAFEFDICVPVSAAVTAIGRVRPWQRPALELVRTLYHGPYEGLGAAWHEFGVWTEANGIQTASDLYECYLVGPDSSRDSADWQTELSRPVIASGTP
jgi:effector-binding domain-containing protein